MLAGGIYAARLADISSSSVATSNTINDMTDHVSTLSKLMHDYGMEIVIIAIFLMIFFIFCVVMLKVVSKTMGSLLEQSKTNSGLSQEMVKKIIDSYIENKNNVDNAKAEDALETKKSNLVTGASIATSNMNDASRFAMGKIHCDRIAIYVFHNGNHTQFGFPFVKMTCINEFNMKGMSSTIRGMNHRNIPLQSFTNIIQCLIENGEYAVSDIFDHGVVNADEQLLEFVSGSMVKALFALVIKDEKGNIAAFSVAEFREPQDFSDRATYEETKEALQNLNESIKSIVINEDFKKEIIQNRGDQ